MAGDHFDVLSAVLDGVGDVRRIFKAAEERFPLVKRHLCLLMKFTVLKSTAGCIACHRKRYRAINRTRKSLFCTECGTFIKSSGVNIRLLSQEALSAILARKFARYHASLEKGKYALLAMADGDGRYLLNMVEKLPHGNKWTDT